MRFELVDVFVLYWKFLSIFCVRGQDSCQSLYSNIFSLKNPRYFPSAHLRSAQRSSVEKFRANRCRYRFRSRKHRSGRLQRHSKPRPHKALHQEPLPPAILPLVRVSGHHDHWPGSQLRVFSQREAEASEGLHPSHSTPVRHAEARGRL